MAAPRYTRIDGRNSSSNCSTVATIGFVCVCLVAGWMIASSSISPLQHARISFQQIIGVRENGNSLSNQSQTSTGAGREEIFAKDSFNDNENVVSSDKRNELKSGKVDSDDNKAANMTLEKSSNFVPDGDEKVTQNEDKKDEAYKTSDYLRTPVPASSPVQVEQHDIEKNETNEGKHFDGSQDSFGDDSYRKPVGNLTVEEMGQDRVKNPSLEKFRQNQTEVAEIKSDEITHSLEGNREKQGETSKQPNDWPTQSAESEKEKTSQNAPLSEKQSRYSWKLCNTSAGPDYIPCLDNIKAIKKLRSTKHYEHRERHCPDEPPTCLVPLPERYRSQVKWPKSRDKVWFSNVPHTQLVEYKGRQNWVKISGQFIFFPGGGTQFPHGAPHYIDLIQEDLPEIAWGKRTRVILDVGCGVASFGGYLFDKDVLTMSMAPKDEHEAQVQFALERGIPAISGVMGTKRLPFPSKVFDVVHCSRCRVPWHIDGGKLLLELNRVLRPGGYFVWSATPVYRRNDVDVGIWKAMYRLTESMCWELVKISRDKVNRKATAMFKKPTSNDCYRSRVMSDPPLCAEFDNPDVAWNVTLEACMHKLPEDASDRGSQWPELWPSRLEKPPYWLKDSEFGVYGKLAPKDFTEDYEHWKHFVSDVYINRAEIDWPSVRNVMDMRAGYGGFAAALRDLQVWVMNVVPVDSTNTLPIIYERGLFGIYHDWCESFNTYPRTYDLLHADHLFSDLRLRCNFVAVMAEVDRILRPGGKLIVIDDPETVSLVEAIAKSLRWAILFKKGRNDDRILCAKKSLWRPIESQTIDSAFA